MLTSLCVYCGSASGNSARFADAAKALAATLVQRQIRLIYGGGNIGLMGVLADEVMRLGGTVIGVIPKALVNLDVAHHQLTELIVVKDMHERKATMAALSDGFIVLPGGIGTLEELFESLTWLQLNLHQKPIGVINTDHFYDGLFHFLDNTVAHGFLQPHHRALLLQAPDAEGAFKLISAALLVG